MRERKIFGTDGVRDVANAGKMTAENALKLGRALVKAKGIRRAVIGRDTRRSGRMLESALISGISSEGAEVYVLGIMPTPGVSYAVRELKADSGAVISASHNPAEYNGIKFLGSDGCKLSDEEELSIEDELNSEPTRGVRIGKIYDEPEVVREYAESIAKLMEPCAGMRDIVFDCGNGANAETVPILLGATEPKLKSLNAEIISVDYDGDNINAGCGVMHMETLTGYVKARGKQLGFAFDGDADRVLISDKYGRVIDGDIIMWELGKWLKKLGYAGSDKVAATVMSNEALARRLGEAGIEMLRSPVGDRYVLELMRETGAALGGEQSGHIIAREFTSTGDGLCTAMLFLNAIAELGDDPSGLIERFGRYPQRLTNLKLRVKREDVDMRAVNEIASDYEGRLRDGRILIRLSGTEPLLRILVEASKAEVVEELTERLTSTLKEYC